MLSLMLTIPVTSVTAEWTFSALKRLNISYLLSSVTEKSLNNCLVLRIHKELTKHLNLISIAREFVAKYEERKRYFDNF